MSSVRSVASIGLVITFVSGYLLSLIGPAPNPAELTGLVRGLEPAVPKSC
jgi:hypothetical protein